MEADYSCLTYENVLVKDELWSEPEKAWIFGEEFSLPTERKEFMQAAQSKLWFTYRRSFSPVGGTGPTSDAGWGCMLRCGQMMLAQTLIKLKLQKDWKWRPNELQNSKYYDILEKFADKRSSCYSIQQIAQMGVQEGKNVGEWFGPNTVAQVLKKLSVFDDDNDLSIYIAMDNTICIEDVETLCNTLGQNDSSSDEHRNRPFISESGSECNEYATSENNIKAENSITNKTQLWKPLLVIIPLRLGLDEINPLYFKNIKECLKWKETVGIIGGKPNHAYYFIGFTNENNLVFLDPHTTQPTTAFNTKDEIDIDLDKSYHCGMPSRMSFSLLDPSLALGFVCRNKSEFNDLCQKVRAQESSRDGLPLFSIVHSFPPCTVVESRRIPAHNRDKHRKVDDDNACLALDSDDDLDDEFEILEIS